MKLKLDVHALGLMYNDKANMGGIMLGSIRWLSRLPLNLFAFGWSWKYKSFNLSILGTYLEREVHVLDWDGNYEMRWNAFWMGFRDDTIDNLRDKSLFTKLFRKGDK